MLKWIFAFALWFMAASAWSQTINEAVEAVRKYSQAVLQRDIDSMASSTHTEVKNRAGGDRQYVALLRDFFARLDAAGTPIVSEEVRQARAYQYPGGRLFLVRTTRYLESFPSRLPLPHVYVVVKPKDAVQWSFIDLSCVSPAWVRNVVPQFSDDGAIAEMLQDKE